MSIHRKILMKCNNVLFFPIPTKNKTQFILTKNHYYYLWKDYLEIHESLIKMFNSNNIIFYYNFSKPDIY